eukprot:gene2200-1367_t
MRRSTATTTTKKQHLKQKYSFWRKSNDTTRKLEKSSASDPISSFRVRQDDVVTFGKLVGDNNPIHSDPSAARAVGFPNCICYGMFIPGPNTVYLRQNLRFVHPVFVGDELLVSVEVFQFRRSKGLLALKTVIEKQQTSTGPPLMGGMQLDGINRVNPGGLPGQKEVSLTPLVCIDGLAVGRNKNLTFDGESEWTYPLQIYIYNIYIYIYIFVKVVSGEERTIVFLISFPFNSIIIIAAIYCYLHPPFVSLLVFLLLLFDGSGKNVAFRGDFLGITRTHIWMVVLPLLTVQGMKRPSFRSPRDLYVSQEIGPHESTFSMLSCILSTLPFSFFFRHTQNFFFFAYRDSSFLSNASRHATARGRFNLQAAAAELGLDEAYAASLYKPKHYTYAIRGQRYPAEQGRSSKPGSLSCTRKKMFPLYERNYRLDRELRTVHYKRLTTENEGDRPAQAQVTCVSVSLHEEKRKPHNFTEKNNNNKSDHLHPFFFPFAVVRCNELACELYSFHHHLLMLMFLSFPLRLESYTLGVGSTHRRARQEYIIELILLLLTPIILVTKALKDNFLSLLAVVFLLAFFHLFALPTTQICNESEFLSPTHTHPHRERRLPPLD